MKYHVCVYIGDQLRYLSHRRINGGFYTSPTDPLSFSFEEAIRAYQWACSTNRFSSVFLLKNPPQ